MKGMNEIKDINMRATKECYSLNFMVGIKVSIAKCQPEI